MNRFFVSNKFVFVWMRWCKIWLIEKIVVEDVYLVIINFWEIKFLQVGFY